MKPHDNQITSMSKSLNRLFLRSSRCSSAPMQTNHVRMQRSQCLRLHSLKLLLFFFLSASFAEAECFCEAAACVNTHAGSRRSAICQAAPYLFISALSEKTRQQLGSKVVSGIASPYLVSGEARTE